MEPHGKHMGPRCPGKLLHVIHSRSQRKPRAAQERTAALQTMCPWQLSSSTARPRSLGRQGQATRWMGNDHCSPWCQTRAAQPERDNLSSLVERSGGQGRRGWPWVVSVKPHASHMGQMCSGRLLQLATLTGRKSGTVAWEQSSVISLISLPDVTSLLGP
jgi:hypothetical protein